MRSSSDTDILFHSIQWFHESFRLYSIANGVFFSWIGKLNTHNYRLCGSLIPLGMGKINLLDMLLILSLCVFFR
ncbi:uncharacterized protein B0P05DRAFT_524704, partial [Gilbertella persicaria]|uniref:uncharacterized protein n=1 Tax=Gilbertella persicaria TaxID=101096 RepID=UPI002220A206